MKIDPSRNKENIASENVRHGTEIGFFPRFFAGIRSVDRKQELCVFSLWTRRICRLPGILERRVRSGRYLGGHKKSNAAGNEAENEADESS
jgi:hypothetical protein